MRRSWQILLAVGVFLTGSAIPISAQTPGRVIGLVRDASSSALLVNASVTIDGKNAARTGDDGRYIATNVVPGSHKIRVQLLGYAMSEGDINVAADATITYDVGTRAVSVALQQVVVVGYGSQKRSDLTGAVASVTPNVDRAPITSLEQTLQGTAPGVQVTQTSSAPGGGMSIRIRGGSSVNGNNEPLYVIDGFPIENNPADGDPTTAGRTNTAPSNPLAALNPSDIAAIEIMKDASATAIYGSRGANGVVVITTKRGEGGRPRLPVDAYSATQSLANRYDLLNGAEFATFANEWAVAQNQTKPFAVPASFGAGTAWQSAIFRRASMTNLQLGVTGGTTGLNPTHYALSGGVSQQNGVVTNSDFKASHRAGMSINKLVASSSRVICLSRV